MDTRIIAIRAGNQKAFRLFYDDLKHPIYNYAFRFFRSAILAEEIVQEVFMQIWKHRATLDPTQSAKAYTYRIARNLIYNKLKEIVRHEEYINHVFYSHAVSHEAVEDSLDYKELQQLYEEAISKLPPQRQLIFRMSRIEFLSHEEIADQLAISKNTVKDQIVKALKFIKQYMLAHTEFTMGLIGALFLMNT
ncbi:MULTISPECIES: RNA polymerase sigma-70 factor [Olivibacter]|uniref:RNA polymerase sigma-70 factor n=1 Tax=Olivibacter oleidegradans TaxID=760123 RepID=A0ABV6HCY3_9SPHI|nr:MULTISPECIES: RNA polymerase sigma-70 factor [Olivibacter]QEK99276.1 RNA polymerase sigma-70 factor [Olivibacter sp. LS-1]